MQQKRPFFPIFLFFFILSLLAVFLSRQNMLFGINLFQNTLFPIQGTIFSTMHLPNLSQNTTEKKLENENLSLTKELVTMTALEKDNTALRDQFATTTMFPSTLIPATVIGDPEFIPGISAPETLILNKGNADGIQSGDVVVYETNLIGSVMQITDHASFVTLVTNKATSFTVKTNKTGAQGVLTGQGNGTMVMGNVLLSDSLKTGDIVLTNGSQTLSGQNNPPDLIVGKIISVRKDPSSLYQSASVQSLVQVQKLTTVFIEIK